MMNDDSHLIVLQKAIEKKKQDFKGFSLRWLAGQLSISHSYLSQILNSKRELPLSMIDPICNLLDLDDESRNQIFLSLLKNRGLIPPRAATELRTERELENWMYVPQRDFELILNWDAMLLLQLSLLENCDGTIDFFAERMGRTKDQVKLIADALVDVGYLTHVDGAYRRTVPKLEVNSKTSRESITAFHREAMLKGIEALQTQTSETQIDRRLVTSVMVTCAQDEIPQMKLRIAEFLKEFAHAAADQKAESVYQMAIQFFPLEPK